MPPASGKPVACFLAKAPCEASVESAGMAEMINGKCAAMVLPAFIAANTPGPVGLFYPLENPTSNVGVCRSR